MPPCAHGSPAETAAGLINPTQLSCFPVTLFSTVMGTAGLAIAWQNAGRVFGTPGWVGDLLTLLATTLLVMIAVVYALKWWRYPEAARAELRHPVVMNFIPTSSVGILLLAVAWRSGAPQWSTLLWVVGAGLQLGFSLMIMSAWIHQSRFEITQLNPAWFIPVAGNMVVPIPGVFGDPAEISWFFFSIGAVFWLVLFAVVVNRLLFHAPLALRVTPTLFILLAPPSVGFVAYTQLTGELDALARVLYYTALFLAMLLASNALRFFRVPFFVSAWAYSFPLAALTVATLRMGEMSGYAAFTAVGGLLLVLSTAVVAALAVRTSRIFLRREICRSV